VSKIIAEYDLYLISIIVKDVIQNYNSLLKHHLDGLCIRKMEMDITLLFRRNEIYHKCQKIDKKIKTYQNALIEIKPMIENIT
jgi:hypothetical protein